MIAFLIKDLDVRGGTHKQFLELLDYATASGKDFVILTKQLDLSRTYPGFSRYLKKIKVVQDMPAMRWWRRIPFGWLHYISYLRECVGSAEIINIHDLGFEFYLAAFLGKKVVWQINDLPFIFREGVAKDFHGNWHDCIDRCFVRLLSWLFVDCITVNVTKNADRVKRRLWMTARVLYCGITPVGVRHENTATRERFGKKEIQLLSSGVFFPFRNYETLVFAVAILRERGINASLKIFGTYRYCTDYCEKIRSLIKEKNLCDHITILGEIDETEYLRLHKNSDLFCFVNVDQSWGLAVFEAMSAGLPVVVSRSVGATEILHDGIDATFVDPMNSKEIAESIIELMDNFSVYERIQHDGLRLVKEYSWEDAYCRPMMNLLQK